MRRDGGAGVLAVEIEEGPVDGVAGGLFARLGGACGGGGVVEFTEAGFLLVRLFAGGCGAETGGEVFGLAFQFAGSM